MSKNFTRNQKENYRKNYGEMQPLSKTDKNRKKSYRGNYWALVVVLMLSFVCMSGCNSEQKEEEPVASAEPVVTEVADGLEKSDDMAEPEVAEEPEEEEEPEVLEEPTGPQNVNEWVESVDGSLNRVTVWNVNTNQGTLLEDGQVYAIEEGDKLVMRYDSLPTSYSLYLEVEEANSTYAVFDMAQLEGLEQPITITISSEPEYIITFEIGDTNSNIGSSDEEEPNEEINSEGESWVASLDYDEPKLVIFNDETGVNTVVEDGETYQMQPGDQMAVYIPEGYECGSLSYGRDGWYDMTFKDNYAIVAYENNEITTHSIIILDPNYDSAVYTYEILPVD